jgi:hypothetical protein
MIRAVSQPNSVPAWHADFLKMLPAIRRYARIAFRHLKGETRQDAIRETIANALVAFVGLVRRGKMSIALRCLRRPRRRKSSGTKWGSIRSRSSA